MKEASISILKAHLSRYLASVKSGEEVIVTDRGRPVARLTPIGGAGDTSGRVAQLVREGRLRPPTHEPPALPPARGPADPTGRSLRLLLEERAQGR